jgi:hypothetical protein
VQFLLDTCVLAELTRPTRTDADSFISVVSIGEIQKVFRCEGTGDERWNSLPGLSRSRRSTRTKYSAWIGKRREFGER